MQKSKINALFVYSDRFCSCTHKRTFEILQGLHRYETESVDAKGIYYHHLNESTFHEFDVVVFQRIGANGGIVTPKIRQNLQDWVSKSRHTTRFLYDIDDALLDDQDKTPQFIAKLSDAALVPNEFLEKMMSPHQKTHIIRTHVDIDEITEVQTASLGKGFHVGWFSVSANGADLVKEMMKKLPKEIYVHLFSDIIHHQKVKELIAHPNLILNPLIPLKELYSVLKGVDCIINPLTSNEFDTSFLQSKSEIKFALAGAVKKPLIVSPIGSYKTIVEDRKTGLFADTPDEWAECIKALFDNRPLGSAIGENAFKKVKDDYSLERAARDYKNLFYRLA